MKRLSTLHDASPADSFTTVKQTVEQDLGGKLEEFFEYFEETPVGSASIAQVSHIHIYVWRQSIHGLWYHRFTLDTRFFLRIESPKPVLDISWNFQVLKCQKKM